MDCAPDPASPSDDDNPRHECGIAAIYHLPGATSPLCPPQGPDEGPRGSCRVCCSTSRIAASFRLA